MTLSSNTAHVEHVQLRPSCPLDPRLTPPAAPAGPPAAKRERPAGRPGRVAGPRVRRQAAEHRGAGPGHQGGAGRLQLPAHHGHWWGREQQAAHRVGNAGFVRRGRVQNIGRWWGRMGRCRCCCPSEPTPLPRSQPPGAVLCSPPPAPRSQGAGRAGAQRLLLRGGRSLPGRLHRLYQEQLPGRLRGIQVLPQRGLEGQKEGEGGGGAAVLVCQSAGQAAPGDPCQAGGRRSSGRRARRLGSADPSAGKPLARGATLSAPSAGCACASRTSSATRGQGSRRWRPPNTVRACVPPRACAASRQPTLLLHRCCCCCCRRRLRFPRLHLLLLNPRSPLLSLLAQTPPPMPSLSRQPATPGPAPLAASRPIWRMGSERPGAGRRKDSMGAGMNEPGWMRPGTRTQEAGHAGRPVALALGYVFEGLRGQQAAWVPGARQVIRRADLACDLLPSPPQGRPHRDVDAQ